MANCIKCGVALTNDNWHKFSKEQHHYICKICLNKQKAKNRALNPKQNRENRKKWQAKRIKIDPLYRQKVQLKYKFNITLEQYDKMFEEQKGSCATCDKPETCKDKYGNVRRLAVDHNHKTGKVRGLLCAACNHSLGNIKEDIATLLKMIVYLRKYNNEQP